MRQAVPAVPDEFQRANIVTPPALDGRINFPADRNLAAYALSDSENLFIIPVATAASLNSEIANG